MTKNDDIIKQNRKKSRGKKLFVIIAIAVVLAVTGRYVLMRKTNPGSINAKKSQTYTVQRDDLIISVTESGDIKAINSKDIKSEVEGRTSIISIVDEGTVVTAEDVNNGKVLVELDSSEIKERLNRQEIDFSNASSDLTDANESLEIQIKQNESDIQAGQLKVKFALMDFNKYLGETIAELVVADANDSNSLNTFDVAWLIEHEKLGGEAKQKLQELKNDIDLSHSKLERAKDRYNWTQKLFDANYVAETDLKADQLEVQSLEAQMEKNEIALDLFKKYEFPKQVEKLLSDYFEAIRELDRIEARARSQLAQKKANLRNREATYALQKERLEKLQKQFEACTIKATTPGQVVYASSMDRWQRRNRPIEEGAEIYERQNIISIPDTSAMKVEIQVHETWIDKIELGQEAKIVISAFPDETFYGKVLKKAPLANPENWLNPDLKVYSTDVSIEGVHESLKTGMSAEVEIIIDRLDDVLTVPLQSVITVDDKKICYVLENGTSEKREIEMGAFNASFIEIKKGLSEGEVVLLNPPRYEQLSKDKNK